MAWRSFIVGSTIDSEACGGVAARAGRAPDGHEHYSSNPLPRRGHPSWVRLLLSSRNVKLNEGCILVAVMPSDTGAAETDAIQYPVTSRGTKYYSLQVELK